MQRQLEPDLYTDLTEQQERILDYVETCIENGLPPTQAEIAKRFGFKSANAAVENLRALERKERITIVRGVSRGIKLVKP